MTKPILDDELWFLIQLLLPAKLRSADRIDWSFALVDISSTRAVESAQKQDPIPPIALHPD
jgi:hypothetical protein